MSRPSGWITRNPPKPGALWRIRAAARTFVSQEAAAAAVAKALGRCGLRTYQRLEQVPRLADVPPAAVAAVRGLVLAAGAPRRGRR